MFISQAIDAVDALKPNSYGRDVKVGWLSDVDMQIYREIIAVHEGGEQEFTGYNANTDIEATELLVPSPYDELYIHALKRQIDLNNEEYGKYNNDCMLFNSAYTNFYDWYNRQNMSLGEKAFRL